MSIWKIIFYTREMKKISLETLEETKKEFERKLKKEREAKTKKQGKEKTAFSIVEKAKSVSKLHDNIQLEEARKIQKKKEKLEEYRQDIRESERLEKEMNEIMNFLDSLIEAKRQMVEIERQIKTHKRFAHDLKVEENKIAKEMAIKSFS